MQSDDAVRNGALYLDQVDPDWFKKIDVGCLDIASGTFCVLGQLFGAYDNGINFLPDVSQTNAHRFGFQSGPTFNYPVLTTAWLREIMMRRNPPIVEIIDQTLVEEMEELEALMKEQREKKEREKNELVPA